MRDEGDAVNTLQVRDAAHDFAGVGFDDFDLGVVRHIQAPRRRIEG